MNSPVRTILRRSSVPENPQDASCVPMLVGVSSSGPANTPVAAASLGDLEAFGSGELVEAAAAVLARGGAPVYLCRAETTFPGQILAVSKAFAASETVLYGGILVPGADENGEVFCTTKRGGVRIEVLNPGAENASLAVTVSTDQVGPRVAVSLATDAMGEIVTTASQFAAAVSAAAGEYLDPAPQGTGSSRVAPLPLTGAASGGVSYTPRRAGVAVRHLAEGSNTPLSVSVSELAITVSLATDASATPTSTAAEVAAAVSAHAAAGALVAASATGTGAGRAGVWADRPLPFGGSGSFSVSGQPTDRFAFRVRVSESGAVGSLPSPRVRWSPDDGRSWLGEMVLPADGRVSLRAGPVDTGLTLQFSGEFLAGEEYSFETTAPRASFSSVLEAARAALENSDGVPRNWGVLAVLGDWGRAEVEALDALVQGALQSPRKPQCLTQARFQGQGELESEWRASLASEFAGAFSERGLTAVCAGQFEHTSARNGWQYRRPVLLAAVAKRAAIPLHTNLGSVATAGPIENLGVSFGELLHKGATPNGGLFFSARQPRVQLEIRVGPPNSRFGLEVSGSHVAVSCATDGTGACLTTAAALAAAVNGSARASALLRATHLGTGSDAVSALPRVSLGGPPVSHDERVQPGLAHRFVTTCSYSERPGAVFFAGAPTLRGPAEADYDSVERVATVLAACRVAHLALFEELKGTIPTIPQRESETVPAGAITASAANRIEMRVGRLIRALLEKPKADGEPSASPYGDIKPCTVLRNYSLRETGELRVEVSVVHLGRVDSIEIRAGGAIG